MPIRLAARAWSGLLAAVLSAPPAHAFPPYRSTDADTAEAGTVEVRLGLVRVEREDDNNSYFSPLLRTNLGLTDDVELVSELEYGTEEHHLTDGAVGLKWVPWRRSVSVGIEALALIPVNASQDEAGVEAQLLATFRRERVRLHLNGGGFYDSRPEEVEQGWRASLLAELEMGRARPGLEVFAKGVGSESTRWQAGPGVIWDLGPADVRVGMHVGLSRAAPDLATSLWVTWKWPVW